MLEPWCVLKDALISQVEVLSGEAPGHPVADSSREERSDRAERSVKSPCNRGERTSGPQHEVNAAASTDYQPKGVREGRAAHVTAKAADIILNRIGWWTSPG